MAGDEDKTQDRREYPNPPIYEAICNVVFAADARWTIATPGHVYDRFRSDYPAEPGKQVEVQADLSIAAAEKGRSGFGITRGAEKLRLSTEDGKHLVLVSPRNISFHSIRPYEGWKSLRGRVRTGLDLLSNVYDLLPVEAVTMRYINKIQILEKSFELGDYFSIPVAIPENLAVDVAAFFHRTETRERRGPLSFVQTFASTEVDEGKAEFILDLDFTHKVDEPASTAEALMIADSMKETENAVFESLITDKCRELFS